MLTTTSRRRGAKNRRNFHAVCSVPATTDCVLLGKTSTDVRVWWLSVYMSCSSGDLFVVVRITSYVGSLFYLTSVGCQIN
jgi:hypothetical protein